MQRRPLDNWDRVKFCDAPVTKVVCARTLPAASMVAASGLQPFPICMKNMKIVGDRNAIQYVRQAAGD